MTDSLYTLSVVLRIQFLIFEILRNRRGLNDDVYEQVSFFSGSTRLWKSNLIPIFVPMKAQNEKSGASS